MEQLAGSTNPAAHRTAAGPSLVVRDLSGPGAIIDHSGDLVREVVVTGSAGFIGGHLVDQLVRSGYSVVGIDRAPTTARVGLRTVVADLLDENDDVQTALRVADAVFHLAARSGVRDPHPKVDAWRRRDNVEATRRVLALVPLATPLIVTSSSSVYGGARHGRPSRETDRPHPLGGYARSKLAVECLCRRRLRDGGSVVVCRPFTVVGENQRPDMAVASWIGAVRRDEPMEIFGPLPRRRDLTDVRDVADCLVTIAEGTARGTVNIGTGTSHDVRDIATAVAHALGRQPLMRLRTGPPDDPQHTVADTVALVAATDRPLQTDLTDVISRQIRATAHPVADVGGVA
jgi:nucleoside-diphosphate-sugar epimerase